MNHQPFENWLLSEEPLSTEDAQALSEHLRTCEICRTRQSTWSAMSQLIRSTPALSPAPGFATRWHERLTESRRIAHRRQVGILLFIMASIASMLLILIGTQAVQMMNSPLQYILLWAYRIFSIITYANEAANIVQGFLGTFVKIIPLPVWVGFTGLVCFLGVLWTATFKRLTSRIFSIERDETQ
jgi:hypothetical protein